jgi:hypothetical protein
MEKARKESQKHPAIQRLIHTACVCLCKSVIFLSFDSTPFFSLLLAEKLWRPLHFVLIKRYSGSKSKDFLYLHSL